MSYDGYENPFLLSSSQTLQEHTVCKYTQNIDSQNNSGPLMHQNQTRLVANTRSVIIAMDTIEKVFCNYSGV